MKAAIAIAIVGIVVVASVFVVRRPATEESTAKTAPAGAPGVVKFMMEQQWLIRMKLALAEEAEMAPQTRSVGRVVAVPSNRAMVAPPVAGIIQTSAMPRIGQTVSKGETLVTVTQTPTAAEAAQIRIENARIEAERRRLAQAEIEAKARAGEAAHNLARARRLYEKKAYSQRQLELDELGVMAAEAQLAAVREQMRAFEAPSASTSYDVRAPISGTVVGVQKALGEQVNPGEAILEIVALDTVWVEAPVFEKDLGQLAPNMQARFTTTTFPDMEFTGRLVNIGAVIDERTRAATVIFEVDNKSGLLRIGMQANVRLDAGTKTNVVLVPKEAIVDNEGQKIVYVLKSGEEFERRNVVAGDEHGGKVAILEGVRPGERVVTQGAYQLKLQELRPASAGAHTHEV